MSRLPGRVRPVVKPDSKPSVAPAHDGRHDHPCPLLASTGCAIVGTLEGWALSDPIAAILTVGLVGLTVVVLAFSIRRLQAESAVTPRTLWIGAGLPMLTAVAYLAVGGPPFHPVVILAAGVGGLVVGAGMARLTRIDRGALPVRIRQSGLPLTAWVVVYAVAALTALIPISDAQALSAIALAATTGMAVGSQLGLFVRLRAAT